MQGSRLKQSTTGSISCCKEAACTDAIQSQLSPRNVGSKTNSRPPSARKRAYHCQRCGRPISPIRILSNFGVGSSCSYLGCSEKKTMPVGHALHDMAVASSVFYLFFFPFFLVSQRTGPHTRCWASSAQKRCC
jgi:hypothetical protein